MSKYDPLEHFLKSRQTEEVPMTFAEIEKIIGRALPQKASGHRAWWSNNPSNNVMTKAWLAAGYQTERVDMASRRLVFRRTIRVPDRSVPTPPSRGDGIIDRIRATLGGTVTIPAGVDLTAPTGEEWDAGRQ
ncbi:MAG: hypothetical protein ACK4JY_02625 [Brevundimonas sp.]|uniref:DUF7662 domain-containing protein n=1 Tax=Brevundimonas sp. TaxID=1871086 RepID=UPI00391C5B97